MHFFTPKTLKHLLWLAVLAPLGLRAQTEQDALLMNKNQVCVAGLVGYNSWTNYWEGTFKRDNENMGRVSTKVAMLMVNYGLRDNLNLIVNLPYIKTQANRGTLSGMQGVQDISFFVKWKPWQTEFGKNRIGLYAVAGYSVPSHNYNIDFLPMSIGLGSQVVTGRLLADYQYHRFTATLSGAYLRRHNVTVDRSAYFTDRQVNSNEVWMPNVGNFQLRAGYRGVKLIAEAFADNMTTYGGFDIRKNDMPFVSNRMNSTKAGVEAKYYPAAVQGLGFHAMAFHTLAGRNMGQATGGMAGISYVLNVKRPAAQ